MSDILFAVVIFSRHILVLRRVRFHIQACYPQNVKLAVSALVVSEGCKRRNNAESVGVYNVRDIPPPSNMIHARATDNRVSFPVFAVAGGGDEAREFAGAMARSCHLKPVSALLFCCRCAVSRILC